MILDKVWAKNHNKDNLADLYLEVIFGGLFEQVSTELKNYLAISISLS